MAISVAIVTPTQEALSLECDEVVVPGVNGEIGLLPGHVPLITALHPGVLTVVKDSKKSYFAVSAGFAEIEEDKVRILTATCEAAGAIDVERAKKKMADAEAKIVELSPDTTGFADQQRRVRVNRARLNAAERQRSN
ncbi:MAG: ATP synthase F1 subunit epsilon [Deltaproteobacteria bacterium]|nr:ATP synthase F1 subunit epsilon [Deltaproteobacteria bacterium]